MSDKPIPEREQLIEWIFQNIKDFRPIAERIETAEAERDALREAQDGLIEARNKTLYVCRGELDKTIAERDALHHSFKNFHWNLCERFDYCHDEVDWQRDQVSLIEFIDQRQNSLQAQNQKLLATLEEIVKDGNIESFAYGIADAALAEAKK